MPYVPLIRLRYRRENYCDCALVLPDEHLSRESTKLSDMMWRETGRCARGLKILKDFSDLGVNSALSDIGVSSAPIRPSGF